MPTPTLLANRLGTIASANKSSISVFGCTVFLQTLCMLTACLITPPAYGDDQPTQERKRQRSGDQQSRGSKSSSALGQLSSEQQANVQQLQADLQVLAQGLQGAEEEIQALAEDLQGMSLHSPDAALVEELAADLAAAVADGSLSPREMAELAAAVEQVLQSAGLSTAEIATLIDDVEAILEAADVGQAEVQAVVHDLQTIVSSIEAPSNGSKSSKPSSSRRRGRGRS